MTSVVTPPPKMMSMRSAICVGVLNNLDDSDLPTVLRTVGLTGNSEGAVSIFAGIGSTVC